MHYNLYFSVVCLVLKNPEIYIFYNKQKHNVKKNAKSARDSGINKCTKK